MKDFGRREHDIQLSAYRRPAWLVGTKPDARSSDLVVEDADLRHDYWIIRSDDPAKMRFGDVPLDFASVIGAGGLRLNDSSAMRDLVTAKIYALELMRGQYISNLSARSVSGRVSHLLWMVRWRLGLGISRMEALSAPLFDLYCDCLRAEGTLGLVLYESRIESLVADLRGGTWSWPTYERSGRRYLDWNALCAELGFTRQSAIISPKIYDLLRTALVRTDPDLLSDDRRLGDEPQDDSVESMDEVDIEGFRPLSVSSARGRLEMWHDIHKLSHLGLLPHDPISFDPFADVSLSRRAREIGRDADGRTGTPGPEQWLALLDGAARWIFEYSGPLLRVCTLALEKQVELFRGRVPPKASHPFRTAVQAIIDEHWHPGKHGAPSLIPYWRAVKGAPKHGISLEEALKHLITACLILIAGFSARRKNELLSLQVGCAYQDPFGAWWLSSYIEKTIRDIDSVPVPAGVGVASGILERLSREARERSGEPWIANVRRPTLNGTDIDLGKPFIQTNLRFTMNEFAAMLGITASSSGEDWQFSPHQLRRAFAIYYYHGNRFSSLDALSRFLRHFDPEKTRRYITEAMAGALMRMREITDARMAQAEEFKIRGEIDSARIAMTEVQHANDAARAISERASEFEDVRQEAFVDRALETYDGTEEPIGLGAAALYDELEAMIEAAHTKILLTGRTNLSPARERDALTEVLREHAPSLYLEPHPNRHTHCRCKPGDPEDLADAVCLQNKAAERGAVDDTRPDYAFASTTDCLRCRHCCAFSENIDVVDRLLAEHAVASEKAPSEDTQKASKAKYAELKARMAQAQAAVDGKGRA